MQKIFFSKKVDSTAVLDKLFFDDVKDQRIGVKVHFGEKGCKTFLQPEHIKRICEYVSRRGGEPVLIESNVLYRGERTRASTHVKLAKAHGFDFAEIDIIDGEDSKSELVYPVGLKHFINAYVGGSLENYDKIIVATHFKGHILSGFGGTIKNIGMGMATRKGKLRIHASRPPRINPITCNKCGICVRKCNGEAIILGMLPKIDKAKCQNCGGCIAICPKGAVMTPWMSSSFRTVSERMVEYAYAVSKKHEMIYLNYTINITKNCDCISRPQKVVIKDVGLFGSRDMLAVELAAREGVRKNGYNMKGENQLRYGKEIGLGEEEYEIVDVDR